MKGALRVSTMYPKASFKLSLFCCNHTCYCVKMVSVTSASHYITSPSRYIMSASRYHPHYKSRSSILIPWNFGELGETVPVDDHLYTGNPEMGTFIYSEDPDQMLNNTAFHQGLHCF